MNVRARSYAALCVITPGVEPIPAGAAELETDVMRIPAC
jgi:hypothetical protein